MQLYRAGRNDSAKITENIEKAGEGMGNRQSVPRAIRIFSGDNVAVAANEDGLKRA